MFSEPGFVFPPTLDGKIPYIQYFPDAVTKKSILVFTQIISSLFTRSSFGKKYFFKKLLLGHCTLQCKLFMFGNCWSMLFKNNFWKTEIWNADFHALFITNCTATHKMAVCLLIGSFCSVSNVCLDCDSFYKAIC